MRSMDQTQKGKAFEWACAHAIYDRGEAAYIESPQMNTARRCYAYLSAIEKLNYKKGAEAAVRIIARLEPRLYGMQDTLHVALQTDAAGIAGDVRDVLCLRAGGWEIGLSCKHNHEAVKHSRLSDTINFGRDWFGKECSAQYFEDVRAVFGPLRRIRDESAEEGHHALWTEVHDKEQSCYVPVLNAFMLELERLDAEYPREIPALLIRYLIGRNDFYKVIMNERRRYTMIESVNVNGSLNQRAGARRALVDVPVMKLPTRFYEIGFREGSANTIHVVCDQGWNVSMRIHNASSRVEPSLKFDVQLLAMPSSILTQIEPWD